VTLPSIAAGQRPHKVTVQIPGDPVPDGYGGYSEGWVDLDPPVLYVRIQPASVSDLERMTSGTVVTSASHIVTGPYHPDLSTKARLLFTDISGKSRTFTVAGLVNPEERNRELILLCEERLD
jgi:head-tail adaptor